MPTTVCAEAVAPAAQAKTTARAGQTMRNSIVLVS
jgi:hypothetical protein